MEEHKTKILLCSPLDLSSGSGIARWTNHIKRYYSKNASIIDLNIFSMDRSSYIDEGVNPIKRAYWGLKDYYKIINGICTEVSNKKYDIVHIASSASISIVKDIYMLKKLSKYNVKTIVHFHFGRIPILSKTNNWEWKLICKVVKLASKIIVIDKKSYDTLLESGFDNIEFVPNPLAPEIADIIQKNNNITRSERNVLFAGHVYKTKGVYELVEACSTIPDINLKIIGKYEEPIKNDLLTIASKKGFTGWIDFTGNVQHEEVIKEMLSCDVFVLPTYTEGFPNVIIESMACSCAIVTTPVGAIPEMLEEENGKQYGILVAPQNTNELREGIEKMLNNESLKLECRHNVKQRVNDRYNIDAVWKQMSNIWKEII